jgi:predicted Fe-Mo cluster-binding NifX family protein
VTVALPIWQDRVSPVLDTAARLLVVSRRRGTRADRREVILGQLSTESLARSVVELHVDVLLCAALSETLRLDLERRGVRVRRHVCGDAEKVLQAFFRGQLGRSEFRMPGCWGNHFEGTCSRRSRPPRASKRPQPESHAKVFA